MAAGWVKSLQCKSRAYEDVYHPHFKQLTSTTCRDSYQNLKDVVNVDKPKPKPKPKLNRPRPDPFSYKENRSRSVKPKPIAKGSDSGRIGVDVAPFFPTVTELSEGHPSRNVVEIIFHSRWRPKGFSGRVEMVFKVNTSNRALTRFEEYRDLVKLRTGPDSEARCIVDGNEMMRFRCLGTTRNMINGFDGAISAVTYSGSGEAHASTRGGKSRRAMMVCRVIAGRIGKRIGLVDPVVGKPKGCDLGEFDSISGENGELLVFDSRAVLPCFLVIYKL